MHGEKILQITCGSNHTIILKGSLVSEGAGWTRSYASKSYHDVLVFGRNYEGEIGLGHNKDQNEPQLLMHGEQIRQIACGGWHTIILKANHDVLVFGANSRGQLGLGHVENQNVPQLLMHREQIRQIACGSSHTVILKANHDILVFGDNRYGQPCP
jgi:alpha-tubulin suppressor-like RCC1 family protein